jgi:isoleucyl-tRNA synthetase
LPRPPPTRERGRGERGVYVEGFDWLTGRSVDDVTDDIISRLRASGKLRRDYLHTHSYPFCWRCKHPLVFRLVEEWFIKAEEIRPRMLAAAEKVHWQPDYGLKLMQDWLQNMGDWCISRKRFRGLPLPFYICRCCEPDERVAQGRCRMIALTWPSCSSVVRPVPTNRSGA